MRLGADRYPTWVYESAVVAMVLSLTVLLTGSRWQDWVGAAAVQLSFHHAAIAERLAERQRISGALGLELVRMHVGTDHRFTRAFETIAVPCHRWLARTLVGKELCWLAYFVSTRSWPALAGVVVFLAYPLWRRQWRKIKPLAQERVP